MFGSNLSDLDAQLDRRYSFKMVLHPDDYPPNRVYELSGEVELEGNETMDDAFEYILDGFCQEHGYHRDEVFVVSFEWM